MDWMWLMLAALGEAAADFIARFGRPDVVIANAGVSVGTLTERPTIWPPSSG
jgi:NAD(P)-dependent dehydrogenase (short-subunit alcohol dehydrogenase family)